MVSWLLFIGNTRLTSVWRYSLFQPRGFRFGLLKRDTSAEYLLLIEKPVRSPNLTAVRQPGRPDQTLPGSMGIYLSIPNVLIESRTTTSDDFGSQIIPQKRSDKYTVLVTHLMVTGKISHDPLLLTRQT